MLLTLLKGKIHQARVTGADLHYEGSIALDENLVRAAGFLPFEKVEIYNITTGARFETYVILAPAGSGTVALNGAAARLVQVGDSLIICAYALMEAQNASQHQPTVVLVDERNNIKCA
ncbi:MAG: aspartate 1-decarboxylase [Alphaproteobacteria bacterium]|nr:aspartate 1-decarboxylase [Alphaproteobacteria bacterium]